MLGRTNRASLQYGRNLLVLHHPFPTWSAVVLHHPPNYLVANIYIYLNITLRGPEGRDCVQPQATTVGRAWGILISICI